MNYAQPYSLVQCAKRKSKTQAFLISDRSNMLPSHIIEEYSMFSTRAFYIKYSEEEAEIDEGCLFRIEIDAYPEYTN